MEETWEKIFVPVSIRYDTNSPHVFYQALALRLQRLLGNTQILAPVSDQTDFYKEKCIEYLSEFGPPQTNLLLVIDGLDEASGWEVDRALLPRSRRRNLKVVVSARWLAGEVDGKQWRYRVGWDRKNDAEEMGLALLDQTKVADILAKACPTAATPDHIAAELTRSSGGDPLILNYLIEDRLERGASLAASNDQATNSLIPGFAEYFTAWVETQRPSWLRDSPGTDSMVGPIMGTLACALGPISNSDLSAVVRYAFGGAAPITRQTLKPLQRFIIGDGVIGYSLAHPRLAEYFRNDYFQGGDTIPSIEGAFLQYGETTIANVNALETGSGNVSRYLLYHYAQHLRKQHASPEQYIGLIQNGWRLAWEQTPDGERGFARDVATAFDAIAGAGNGTIPQLFRCALCLSSIASLGTRVPPDLAIASVRRGVLSWHKAVEYSKFQGPPAFCVTVDQLLDIIPDDLRPPLLNEAIDAARRAPAASRARALVMLANRHSTIQRTELIEEALSTAKNEADDFEYVNAIAAVLPLVPKKDKDYTLLAALRRLQSLRTLQGLNPDVFKIDGLKLLAPHLSQHLTDLALNIARGLGHLSNRWTATLALASCLGENQRFEEFHNVLALGVREKDVLLEVNPQKVNHAVASRDILDLADSVGGSYSRAQVLVTLASSIPIEDQPRAVRIAESIEYPKHRAVALAGMLPHLTGPTERSVASSLFELLPTVAEDDTSGEAILSSLRSTLFLLSDDQIRHCFELSNNFGDLDKRAACLAVLAPRLSDSEIAQALENAKIVGDFYWCAHDLAEMSTHLSTRIAPKARAQALKRATAIGSAISERDSLVDIATYFPRGEILEVVHCATKIKELDARVSASASLIPLLPEEERAGPLTDVWLALQEVVDTYTIGSVVQGIAANLSQDQLDQTFDRVQDMRSSPFHFERALTPLIPRLGDAQLRRARQSVDSISDGDDKASCLDLYIRLMPRLEKSDRILVLGKSFELFDREPSVYLLEKIVGLLNEKQIEVIASWADSLKDKLTRCKCLLTLIPVATLALRPALLSYAVDALTESLLDSDEIRAHTGFEYSYAIEQLFPSLDGARRGKIMTLCAQITSEIIRAQTIAKLLPYLDGDERKKAVELVVATILSDSFGLRGRPYAEVMAIAAPYMGPGHKRTIAISAMVRASSMSRSDFLSILPTVCQLTRDDDGDAAVDELYVSLLDVLSWYP